MADVRTAVRARSDSNLLVRVEVGSVAIHWAALVAGGTSTLVPPKVSGVSVYEWQVPAPDDHASYSLFWHVYDPAKPNTPYTLTLSVLQGGALLPHDPGFHNPAYHHDHVGPGRTDSGTAQILIGR